MHLHQPLSRGLLTISLAIILYGSVASVAQATPFINPESYDITKIIPPPPLPGSEEYRIDTGFLKNARATSTKGQIERGNKASNDSVFDYSETLGPWFNPSDLPKTATLFKKVTKETKEAIELAKQYFSRTRPETWKETGDQEKSNGYAYPSGHTTRAFVWANLLANALPKEQKALHKQGRQKAWYRVILGRHFPADVRAGKLYGQFLAQEFLKSPEFQKVWPEVCQEIISARKAAKQAQVIQPTGVASDAPPTLKL